MECEYSLGGPEWQLVRSFGSLGRFKLRCVADLVLSSIGERSDVSARKLVRRAL